MSDDGWKDRREKWIVFAVVLFVIGQILFGVSAVVGLLWGTA